MDGCYGWMDRSKLWMVDWMHACNGHNAWTHLTDRWTRDGWMDGQIQVMLVMKGWVDTWVDGYNEQIHVTNTWAHMMDGSILWMEGWMDASYGSMDAC